LPRLPYAFPAPRLSDSDRDIKSQGPRGPDPGGHFFTTVKGVTVNFVEAMPKGEHILDKADSRPPSDYVMIQLVAHDSRSVRNLRF
jgi:hypothetical protein